MRWLHSVVPGRPLFLSFSYQKGLFGLNLCQRSQSNWLQDYLSCKERSALKSSIPLGLLESKIEQRESELANANNHFSEDYDVNVHRYLAQCRKSVVTPPQKYSAKQGNRWVFLNENVRPNQQLDVIEYGVLLQNLMKTFIFRCFFL